MGSQLFYGHKWTGDLPATDSNSCVIAIMRGRRTVPGTRSGVQQGVFWELFGASHSSVRGGGGCIKAGTRDGVVLLSQMLGRNDRHPTMAVFRSSKLIARVAPLRGDYVAGNLVSFVAVAVKGAFQPTRGWSIHVTESTEKLCNQIVPSKSFPKDKTVDRCASVERETFFPWPDGPVVDPRVPTKFLDRK